MKTMYLVYQCYDDFGDGGIIPEFITSNEDHAKRICKLSNENYLETTGKDQKYPPKLLDNGFLDDSYEGFKYMSVPVKIVKRTN
jgi:hypothetical protein